MDYNISTLVYLGCVKHGFDAEAIEYYFYDISTKEYFDFYRLSNTTCYI